MLLKFFLNFFLARKVCLLLYIDFLSEALFTFPVKRFMQELIHSMILSRFHVKDSSLLFIKKLQ